MFQRNILLPSSS